VGMIVAEIKSRTKIHKEVCLCNSDLAVIEFAEESHCPLCGLCVRSL
jgi:hypothetical protein